MAKITIYHGSKEIISKPEYGKGKPYNDYGLGFYCTKHIELAKEWGCVENEDGFANEYEIEISGLKVLNLCSKEYSILNWMAILLENRSFTLNTPLSRKAQQFIIENYLPDYKGYDVIVGYRADDSYFSFAKAFVTNQITLDQLSNAMKLGKLGEQIVIKSKKAFDRLQFIQSHIAKNELYYVKKKSRDTHAREEYKRILEDESVTGLYIADIMRGSTK